MSFVRNTHHIVFSTKHRKPCLTPSVRPELFAYMGGIARKRKSLLMEAGGIADHVHLLVAAHPTLCVSDLVRDIKSGSSRWMQENASTPQSFSWQSQYGSFSVSLSMEETVRAYIRSQEEHHRKQTFQDEFRILLKRHGFEWDERYVWN
jgi:REP element-mobilizing transposase RayT